MKRLIAGALCLLALLSSCGRPPPPEEPPAPGAASRPGPPPPERAEEPVPSENYIRSVASEIAGSLGAGGLPDDERILAAYRWMMENVCFMDPVGQDIWRYRGGQAEPPTFLETMSVSPLVFGVGSCEDFACATALLLEEMGFEARYLPGFTISVDGDYVDHAWTLVRMGGDWYHLDSQLEQNIVRNGETAYRYFLKTDAEMIADHKWGENLIAHFRDIPREYADRIRAEFTPPACVTPYPQRRPGPVAKPARPDRDALLAQIQRERETHGVLPEIPLENVPPVLIPPSIPGAGAPAVPAGAPPPYGRSFLAGAQRALYDEAVSRAERYDLSPIPAAGLSEGELAEVADAVLCDNPQLYWLTLEPGAGDGRVLRPGVAGGLTPEEAKRRRAEIDRAAAELLRGAGADPAAAAELLHDRLAASIRYDAASALPDTGNLYGGLVRREGVCDAYARSYQYLLTLAGIENCYIAGSSARGITHSWNAVRLGDGWYYTDVTWDSPKETDRAANPGLPPAYHDYLAVSFGEISLGREFLAGQYPRLPAGAGGADNYYVRNGYAVDPAGGRLTELLAEAFARQLEAVPPQRGGVQYLDAKLLCPPAEYPRYKRQYTEGLFEVLRETERAAKQRGLPLRFETEGETGVSFNDAMQILVFHPRIYPAD